MPRQRSNSTATRRTTGPAKKPISHAPKRRDKSTAAADAALAAVTGTPGHTEDDMLRTLAQRSPAELFQAEKQRRAGLQRQVHDPLAEARREYEALLASEAGTPRGGRPRKGRPKKSELSLEDSLEEFKGSDAEHDDE